jgi:poly(3-hydroxybutyrate) depolymerase
MKKLMTVILMLCFMMSQAQLLTKELFPVDASGGKRAGVLWTPEADDKLHPLFIFHHGKGEAGDGTITP